MSIQETLLGINNWIEENITYVVFGIIRLDWKKRGCLSVSRLLIRSTGNLFFNQPFSFPVLMIILMLFLDNFLED